MRSPWVLWGPPNPMTSVLRQRQRDVGSQTQRRRPCEDAESRVMRAQAEQLGRQDSSLEPAEGAPPCQHLDFGLLASRAMEESISVIVSYTVCGGLL